ncbi:MAG: HlyC/CorC family transporter [Treponema sp.]|nr:HlyC/CorC family transporter [Candidatus Treponema equifaecale]
MQILFDFVLPSVGLVILVAIVAFFASSETAYLSITKVMLKQMLKKDDPNKKNTPTKRVAYLKRNTDQLLSLILIGINFVTSFASGLAATIAIGLLGDAGSFYATVVMTFVLIIFGEIMPKTISAYHPMAAAKAFSLPLMILQKIFFPIVWFFAKITNGISFILNKFIKKDRASITEEELKSLIEVGEHEGTLEHSEKKMLYKIFDFTDLHARDIMRHRSMVTFIPENAEYSQVIRIFRDTGYSRIPVCGIDETTEDYSFENVIGFIFYKDVLLRSPNANSKRSFARRCMRPALFVPETLTATEILLKFKKEKVNFAICIDENGCNSGIVTMDDILKAVFGRSVSGENDEVPPENRIQTITPREFMVPGDMKLGDLNELLKLELESEDYDTLGGWLLEQFDELPETGEVIRRDGIFFKIELQAQRRIQSVRIRLPKEPLTSEK